MADAIRWREVLLNDLEQFHFALNMALLGLDGGVVGELREPRPDAVHRGGMLRVAGIIGTIPKGNHGWLVHRRWNDPQNPWDVRCWPKEEVVPDPQELTFETAILEDGPSGVVAIELILADDRLHEFPKASAAPALPLDGLPSRAVPTLAQVFIEVVR